ncbi:glutathione S-transferase N-terminal domain-containing protein [Sphingopyxis panaciterrulae]|uniref:Glutathione S-transferase n=1 Tax=Sphingopyxis panaciterrulae TaxID=462372 RepID=A0A7W9EU14_9SPHN|nr:glutathione S-transferase N-terminal domain-containing protein [Sphingopyxis panaciterrulae]MBB5708631.1 glutathione S-transferase [Sphingopyxis panaciterrulae]
MTRPILYHCPDARSLRCLWAAEEAGLAIDLRLLPFPPRAFAPDYRAINPLMTVPGWVEDGRLMTESIAICERIAEDQRAIGTPFVG